jgi:transposase
MSFIRYKIFNGKKYAYKITSYWDSKTKQSRHKSEYLGAVDDHGEILPKIRNRIKRESLILDFGNGYLLHEFIKQSELFPIFSSVFQDCSEIFPLIFYKIIMQSAMYNAESWIEGNILSKLYPKVNLSSQNTSHVFKILGDEFLQRQFFSKYLKTVAPAGQAVIIDATSLPNEIQSGFNAWGRCDNAIEKQFRFLCVTRLKDKKPLFYRYLPGNITDVSTLTQTIEELSKLGVKNSYILIDSGYFSENNIRNLYKQNIDFLSRLPASRREYKRLIRHKTTDLESIKYATKFGNRGLFIKREIIDLYGKKAYAYIVLDPTRKGKEINQLLIQHFDDPNSKEIDELKFSKSGIMILVSSNPIHKKDIVASYYMRQSIEQIFGYCKADLSILPIRRHNEDTIRGYLFLQFLALIFYLNLSEKLPEKYTIEQSLLKLRNLKCKVFEDEILISEPTKEQRLIFEAFSIIVPKKMGI